MLLYDLGILLACGCVLLMSTYREGSFAFTEKWFVPLDPANDYLNGFGPNPSEQLPKPVVTDVNADGWADVVLCTREPSVKVLTFFSPAQLQQVLVGGQGAASSFDVGLNVMAEASLQSSLVVKLGRMPIALATGYISPPEEGVQRKQVIAVVTDGWHVVLFDHQLEVLWERTVSADLATQYVGEVSVLIGSTPLYEGDQGFVVVGGRLVDNVYDAKFAQARHESQELRRQAGAGGAASVAQGEEGEEEWVHEEFIDRRGNKFHGAANSAADDAQDVSSRLEHFNFYAFEAASGDPRWSHESADFFEENDAAALRHPQHGAKARGRDAGELDWRNFQDDLRRALPHLWHDRDDTTFTLHHFERKRQGKQSSGGGGAPEAGEGPLAFFNGLLGMGGAHSASDHVVNPNVLIAHSSQGVEAVHLYTGRTLCKLSLEKDVVHLDVNADNVIDHVGAVGGAHSSFVGLSGPKQKEDAKSPTCLAYATTGIPARRNLFNGTICEKVRRKVKGGRRSARGKVKASKKFNLERDAALDNLDEYKDVVVTRPLPLLRAPARESLDRLQYDSVFLVNNGIVSAYDPAGNQRFLTPTKCSYLNGQSREGALVPRAKLVDASRKGAKNRRKKRRRSSKTSKLTAAEAHELQQQEKSFVSSLVGYSVYAEGDLGFSSEFLMKAEALHINTAQHILVAGEQHFCLLDNKGRLLSDSVLPYVPVSEPVVADFDHDGRNDVVIITTDGIHGYVMEIGVGSYLFTVLLVLLMVVLVFVMFIKMSNSIELANEDTTSAPRGKKKKPAMSLFDSQRYHRKYH
jgi:hypothetical protein